MDLIEGGSETHGINMCNFPSVMGAFKVLDGRGEDIGAVYMGRSRQQEYLL